MVKLAQIIGAAALLSQSVLAAPAMRRSQYQQEYDNSYKQPAQYDNNNNQYTTQPSYDNQYTTSVEETSVAYETTSTSAAYETTSVESTSVYETTSVESTSVYETTSAESTSAYETTSVESTSVHETKSVESTSVHETTSAAYETPTYGSGQSNWGKSYEDCVSQCVAQYGTPPKEWAPSEPMPPPQGTGAVHTVMVAPTAGVLRYWPFAVNATVGDTIRYVWTTSANHTATLSSALAICNRSAKAEELNWVSGIRNASAGTQTFDVTIQTEEQQFFYCSVGEHCSKGMFGMVQPKNGGNNTVSFHMNKWLESNPDLKAAWAVVHEQTKGTSADTWGNNISVDDIPEEAHQEFAANLIWNRAMFAANPGTLEANSAATPDGSPLKLVGDLSTLLSATNQDPNQSGAPEGTPTGEVPVPSAVASELANAAAGAGFKTSVPVWVAAFVGVVSYLVL